VSVGSPVARWEDKSGNARHATQATGASQPIRTAISSLDFDGTNDYLTTPAFAGAESWTRFVVYQKKDANFGMLVSWGDAYNSPNPGADYLGAAATITAAQNGGPDTTKLSVKETVDSVAGIGVKAMVAQVATGTNTEHQIVVNGAVQDVTNSYPYDPLDFTKAATAYCVGAYNTGGNQINAHVFEVRHYSNVMGAAVRAAIESELASKWGITLS